MFVDDPCAQRSAVKVSDLRCHTATLLPESQELTSARHRYLCRAGALTRSDVRRAPAQRPAERVAHAFDALAAIGGALPRDPEVSRELEAQLRSIEGLSGRRVCPQHARVERPEATELVAREVRDEEVAV